MRGALAGGPPGAAVRRPMDPVSRGAAGGNARAVLVAIALATASAAAAQEPKEPLFTFRGHIEWISALRGIEPVGATPNAGNDVLRLPQWEGQSELRPSLRVEAGSRWQLVVRPRVIARGGRISSDNLPDEWEGDASANWTELYLAWRPNDVLLVTYGLQNFQWGPAELLAPSNRIFHETGVFRDPLYYVRGRHLARVNVSIGKEWSLVALAELGSNGEASFVANEPFRRQGQMKMEYATPSGAGYVGVTAGARLDSRPWFGEYGSISLTEGLSAYVDATHAKGSHAWYPATTPAGSATFVQRDLDSDSWRTLAITGLRYTFASGIDVRGEFMYQDAGYSAGEMDLAALAASSAPSREAFEPYLYPGLEFLGRHMTLASVRVPDLPPRKQLVVDGRYLWSFTDDSGVAFVTASLEAADALVLFVSAALSNGSDTDEFSRLASATLVGGAVYTW